jgi:hypothetical protein
VLEESDVIPTIQVADEGPIAYLIARRIGKSMTKSRTDDRGLLLTRRGRIVMRNTCSNGPALQRNA